MNALETIKAARELISEESAWTKGSFARTEENLACGERSRRAVKWCLLGALLKINCYPRKAQEELKRDMDRPGLLQLFNDVSKHSEVISLFDKTIERLTKNVVNKLLN